MPPLPHFDGTERVPLLDMTLVDALGWSSLISTCAIFLCGIPICRRIVARGNTDRTPVAPFLLGVISSSFWLRYGQLRGDATVEWVNGIGVVVQSSYLSFYYLYTRPKSYLHRQLATIAALIVAMLYYVHANVVVDKPTVVTNVGLACVLLNIMSLSAPLAGLRDVLRTQTTESVPFALSAGNMFVCVQWLMYGALVGDPVIIYPNAIGVGLAAAQLSLFVIYPPARLKEHTAPLKM